MRTATAATTLLGLLSCVSADVYMQSPRGANGRNAERNVNRNNANRLYDTQNNAKGGYAAPRAVGGPEVEERPMYYYEGEKIPITWTAQHGSGAGGNVDGQIILQWGASATFDPTSKFSVGANVGTPRDGIPANGNDAATDRIPANAASALASTTATRRFGMHESFDYYDRYSRTEREKGLYTADQNLNRNDARATRQNPNGNRNGLEIPEERDHYPWSNPSPWVDIAVLDMKYTPEKEKWFQQNSHVQAKGLCVGNGGNGQAQALNQRNWPNNAADCAQLGADWTNTLYGPDYNQANGPIGPMPIVATLAPSSSNHLGAAQAYANPDASNAYELCLQTTQQQQAASTQCAATEAQCVLPCAWMAGTCRPAVQHLATTKGRNKCPGGSVATGTFFDDTRQFFDDNTAGTGTGSTYYWSIPFGVAKAGLGGTEASVLRMRYNMSSHDFPSYTAGDNYLSNKPFDAAPGVNASYNCRGDTNQAGRPCSAVSPVTQDPYIQVRGAAAGATAGQGNGILSLALNTNQYARTFQDRTYVFKIVARPTELMGLNPKIIVGLTVKGKRGNIVQTYPAVEYDFFPKELIVDENAQVHIQWTGSDYNPQRGCNNGEGGPPDCQGCTTLAQANAAANQNSRADRTNLVPMGSAGRNFPAGARGSSIVDLYDASSLTGPAGADAHPFASAWGAGIQQGVAAKTDDTAAVAWNLMYIGQEAELQAKFGVGCLSQTDLENINNENQRENTPQNCAKLSGKAHPYFDAGVVNIKSGINGATATQGKTYAFFSSRNNNFSNRDQTMNICVRSAADATKTTCRTPKDPQTQMPNPLYNPFSNNQDGGGGGSIDGIQQPINVIEPDGPPLTDETTAPIEKDNDSVGSGDAEACEARVDMFIRSVGLAGLIAIACALFALGVMGTLVMQACYSRMNAKDNNWRKQEGVKI